MILGVSMYTEWLRAAGKFKELKNPAIELGFFIEFVRPV